jgi:hypothetical protein
VTTINATDDTIIFAEQGTYEFFVNDTACKASVSRSRTFKLVQRAGEAPAASASAAPTAAPTAKPTAEPRPEPPPGSCDEVGAPARFEVRPTRKLLRPGESFTLTSIVSDAKGCRIGGAAPELEIEKGGPLEGKLTVDKLRVEALADAPAGTANVVATLGGKSVTVLVEVAPPDKYDELLALRGLNEAGEDDTVLVAEIATGLGGSTMIAEDAARARKRTFVAIVGAIAAALALGGFVMIRRGKRSREGGAREERETFVAPPPNVALFDETGGRAMRCTRCGASFPEGTAFCADDGAPLVPGDKIPIEERASLDAVPSSVPASAPVSAALSEKPRSKKAAKAPDKICPSCGDRFGAEAQFCGKDGTTLVPIN